MSFFFLFQTKGRAPRWLSLHVTHDCSSAIVLFARPSTANSPSNFSVFHLLPHSLMSGPFILSFPHTHISDCHAPAPAPLLPLQLHFICCRSSRVAPLNDSTQPVVGVWVLLIMPVSLWGEKYRQIRVEYPGAVAPISSHLMGASRTQSKNKVARHARSDGGLEVRYLGSYLLRVVQK